MTLKTQNCPFVAAILRLVPDEPLGYFLTFATYGSWLHGDVRDSKDRHHNAVGEAPRRRDDFLAG